MKCYTVTSLKGFHVYFLYDERCPNTTNVFESDRFCDVDIRNDGGVIYAPPTKYQLLDGTTAEYKYIGGNIKPVPELLITMLKKNKENEIKPKSQKVKKDEIQKVRGSFFIESNVTKLGKTLGDGMSTNELKLLPEYQRYLYSIPAQDDRNVWISIGFALKTIGASLNDFERFSKLGGKYQPGEFN